VAVQEKIQENLKCDAPATRIETQTTRDDEVAAEQ